LRYVVDANVLLKSCLPETDSVYARDLVRAITAGRITAIAPQILVAEVGHTLRREVLRKRLPKDDAGQIWRDLCAVPVELFSIKDLGDSAWELALQNMARFYDALYVALAVREDLKVITADERMVNAFAKLDRAISLTEFRLP
jgi:predicted nucleic acid-binding protein